MFFVFSFNVEKTSRPGVVKGEHAFRIMTHDNKDPSVSREHASAIVLAIYVKSLLNNELPAEKKFIGIGVTDKDKQSNDPTPPEEQFTVPPKEQFIALLEEQFITLPEEQFIAPPEEQFKAPPEEQFIALPQEQFIAPPEDPLPDEDLVSAWDEPDPDLEARHAFPPAT
ncbi:hypothetical protein C0995_014955 [Termitomyces sp. Mi166|nr:hypothetical protein C0995_014955 [Termitomyces sp. Mi166\